MNRVLTLLALVVFASSLFMRSVDPVVPQIAGGLGVEPSTAALLSTAFALPYALIQPVLGALADMFSKARLMMGCLAVLAAASVVCAVSSNFEVLVGARVVAGLAAGGVVPIALAFVGDLVPIGERQVAISRILFAIMTGNLLGASGAGVLGDLFGWRAVFIGMAVLGFATLVVAVPGLRGAGKGGGRFDLSTLGPNYRAIFRNPLAKICFGSVFLEGLFMYGVFPHMASLLQSGGVERASIAGIVIAGFAIGGASYSLVVGWVLPRLGEQWMMRMGGAAMGFSLAVIASRAPWPVQFANFMVLGLGFYSLHAVIQVYVTELAPTARGSALALHSFFYFLGQAAGPAVYGAAFAVIGPSPILLFGAGVLVIVGLVCGHYLRRKDSKA
jgi:predicted MFS family arabinose efflux permease